MLKPAAHTIGCYTHTHNHSIAYNILHILLLFNHLYIYVSASMPTHCANSKHQGWRENNKIKKINTSKDTSAEHSCQVHFSSQSKEQRFLKNHQDRPPPVLSPNFHRVVILWLSQHRRKLARKGVNWPPTVRNHLFQFLACICS